MKSIVLLLSISNAGGILKIPSCTFNPNQKNPDSVLFAGTEIILSDSCKSVNYNIHSQNDCDSQETNKLMLYQSNACFEFAKDDLEDIVKPEMVQLDQHQKRTLQSKNCSPMKTCYECGKEGSICEWNGSACGPGSNDK